MFLLKRRTNGKAGDAAFISLHRFYSKINSFDNENVNRLAMLYKPYYLISKYVKQLNKIG
jgi:hypothetical protein